MSSALAPRPAALVDIDSTLYDANRVWCQIFREVVGIDMTPREVVTWDYRRQFVSREVFARLVSDYLHNSAAIRARLPYAGAPEALRAWHGRGVRIIIASDRAPEAGAATRDWLASWHIPYDSMLLGSGLDKVTYARQLGVGLIIDDQPATIIGAHAAGIPVATMVHQYNKAAIAQTGAISGRSWTIIRRQVEAHVSGFRP